MSKKSAPKKSAKTKVRRVKAKTKVVAKTKKTTTKVKQVTAKKAVAKKSKSTKKAVKKTSFLAKLLSPIISFNRYLKNSWRELKKVRWPSRKETWQKVLSIIIYGLFFIFLVILLDNLYDWLFKLMLGA